MNRRQRGINAQIQRTCAPRLVLNLPYSFEDGDDAKYMSGGLSLRTAALTTDDELAQEGRRDSGYASSGSGGDECDIGNATPVAGVHDVGSMAVDMNTAPTRASRYPPLGSYNVTETQEMKAPHPQAPLTPGRGQTRGAVGRNEQVRDAFLNGVDMRTVNAAEKRQEPVLSDQEIASLKALLLRAEAGRVGHAHVGNGAGAQRTAHHAQGRVPTENNAAHEALTTGTVHTQPTAHRGQGRPRVDINTAAPSAPPAQPIPPPADAPKKKKKGKKNAKPLSESYEARKQALTGGPWVPPPRGDYEHPNLSMGAAFKANVKENLEEFREGLKKAGKWANGPVV